jgi:hypothetical protein
LRTPSCIGFRFFSNALSSNFLCIFCNRYRRSGKGTDRSRWLNSPNVYQKVEVLETGTPDPKKITKVEVIRIEQN